MRDSSAPAPVPVLVLGGEENALSIARSLGRRGIDVAVSAPVGCAALDSRYCRTRLPVPPGTSADLWWERLLLSSNTALDGRLLLAGSDEALEFLANHHPALADRYLLDEHDPELRHALLDKLRTLELAREAGVPTPGWWPLRRPADLAEVIDRVQFPAMLKPLKSHEFQRCFPGRKHVRVADAEALQRAAMELFALALDAMVCEIIPGPDRLLSSYYTYLDAGHRPLFELTKHVLRRFPVNEGGATYHVTDWDPETAELGRRFFHGIGLRGLGNVEFKRDPRDGQLKLIECNARFTAAQELLVRSGLDIAVLIYRHLTGTLDHLPDGYQQGRRMWYPKRDFQAWLQLRSRGEMGLGDWLGSVAHPAVLPYFSLRDPGPTILRTLRWLGNLPARLLRGRQRPCPASRPGT